MKFPFRMAGNEPYLAEKTFQAKAEKYSASAPFFSCLILSLASSRFLVRWIAGVENQPSGPLHLARKRHRKPMSTMRVEGFKTGEGLPQQHSRSAAPQKKRNPRQAKKKKRNPVGGFLCRRCGPPKAEEEPPPNHSRLEFPLGRGCAEHANSFSLKIRGSKSTATAPSRPAYNFCIRTFYSRRGLLRVFV